MRFHAQTLLPVALSYMLHWVIGILLTSGVRDVNVRSCILWWQVESPLMTGWASCDDRSSIIWRQVRHNLMTRWASFDDRLNRCWMYLLTCCNCLCVKIYLTSVGEQDKADDNALHWSLPVGFELAYINIGNTSCTRLLCYILFDHLAFGFHTVCSLHWRSRLVFTVSPILCVVNQ